MNDKYIDMPLTKQILSAINNGSYDNVKPVIVKDIPSINGNNIIDRANLSMMSFDFNTACKNLRKINTNLREDILGTKIGRLTKTDSKEVLSLTIDELEMIGVQLYPYVSYGILNGGSATSYTDTKKNKQLNADLLSLYKKLFERSVEAAKGKPKGIVPAFVNHDGSRGPSFMELKLRALFIENLRYRFLVNSENELFKYDYEANKEKSLFPLFQLTSVYTDAQIKQALETYKSSPVLKELIEKTGIDITETLTGVQPMIAAFTHSSVGKPKQIFTDAFGRDGEMLPLPGGHGQNFMILSNIYRYLHDELGKRFVYLTNVDNIGNLPDAASIAITAMNETEASFEFSFRTSVDVKGGILVEDQFGRLNCADIGPAISKEDVDSQESSGKTILFNCATGLFKLDYLKENLDEIIEKLPMRISDQAKDAGLYSQAEQVTWEIIGMLKKPLILCVDKYKRYIAAKFLLESLMTSGILLDSEDYPTNENPSEDFSRIAENLYRGLRDNLENVYKMKLEDKNWKALSVEEIIAAFTNRILT